MHHHHTQEKKRAAIDLYISSGFSPTTVKRTLGHPSRSTLSQKVCPRQLFTKA